MRFGVVDHRSSFFTGGDVIDIEQASAGSFSSDAAQIFPAWASFVSWATERTASAVRRPLLSDAEFGAPSPRPSQVFVIDGNYAADQAREAQMDLPEVPMVITKFSICITSATAPLLVAHPCTDRGAELVIITGSACVNVPAADASAQVAGLTIGPDISDRELQFTGQPPQFSLDKSGRGYDRLPRGSSPPMTAPTRAIWPSLHAERTDGAAVPDQPGPEDHR